MNIKFVFDIIDSQITEYNNTVNKYHKNDIEMECLYEGKVEALNTLRRTLIEFVGATNLLKDT